MGSGEAHGEIIHIRAEISSTHVPGVRSGTSLPVQLVSESGISFPVLTGTVVSVSPVHSSSDGETTRLDIAISLSDLSAISACFDGAAYNAASLAIGFGESKIAVGELTLSRDT